MAISPRRFHQELYIEHLEESSFLYEQRRLLVADDELPWPRLLDFEERLEAHLDALSIGGDIAAKMCAAHGLAGDAGELFASVAVFCRNRDAAALAATWRAIDFNDPGRVQALTDALKWELPDTWRSACEQALRHGDDRLVPVLAATCAYRRIPVTDLVADRLQRGPGSADARTVWALSRLPLTDGSVRVLHHRFLYGDSEGKSHAAFGLLRAGVNVLESMYGVAEVVDWPHLAMGVAGDQRASQLLRQQLDAGTATRHTVIALALLGDPSCVRSLCSAVGSEPLGRWAAWALHWITGAPFMLDVSAWEEWLKANAERFERGVRYRKGERYSPRAVFKSLADPASPWLLRQLAYEELVVRFGCDVPFEADDRVATQIARLDQIAAWVETTAARFDALRGQFLTAGAG